MPAYESNSLYIDFSRLSPPKVIEEIDYEVLVANYKAQVLERNPALERALKLEQSPLNITLETEAYTEMMVRSRVNAAARAVMLAFATGSDLDHLAAFYGVKREIVPGDKTVFPAIPDVIESDDSLRRRAQMGPEALATAGSEGAYIFHALSADITIRDASAAKIDDHGGVSIRLMNSVVDPVLGPVASIQQISAVFARLTKKNIRPLTDVISVASVDVVPIDIRATVTLYPGPNGSLVMKDIEAGLQKLRSRVSMIGMDLTRSAIHSAIYQEGVQNVQISNPPTSISISQKQCVWIRSVTVDVSSEREE